MGRLGTTSLSILLFRDVQGRKKNLFCFRIVINFKNVPKWLKKVIKWVKLFMIYSFKLVKLGRTFWFNWQTENQTLRSIRFKINAVFKLVFWHFYTWCAACFFVKRLCWNYFIIQHKLCSTFANIWRWLGGVWITKVFLFIFLTHFINFMTYSH